MTTWRNTILNQNAGPNTARLLKQASVFVLSSALLVGCAGPRYALTGKPQSAVVSLPNGETSAKAARAGSAYQRNPHDPEAAFAYAKALRELGRANEAVTVLSQATRRHPSNKDLVAEYAKSLTASGRASESIAVFAAARQLNPRDWSLMSAEGIALDQIGKHRQARQRYALALELSPDNPDILTNLALSHTLSGNLSAAEAILRRAASTPSAGSQVRQNLALVLALRGRFNEAELMMADLDPATADANLKAMREMFQQPALWASATETAPVGDVARVKIGAEDPQPTVGQPASGVTAGLPKAPSQPEPPPAATPDSPPAVAPNRSSSAKPQRVPAAQSEARSGPRLLEPLSNGLDTTFFSFE